MTRGFGACGSLAWILVMLSASHVAGRPAQSGGGAGQAPMVEVRQDSVVRALVIGRAWLVLDSSFTLDSVQHILGKTILIAPHHHDDPWNVCYSARDSIGPFTIRFQSNELGGPEHQLLGFELLREPKSARQVRACASLGAVYGVKTDNGLYLGMPVSAVLKAMGRPVRTQEGEYSFIFHRQVTDSTTRRDGAYNASHPAAVRTYDIEASLDVRVKNGRVVSLAAWYGEYM